MAVAIASERSLKEDLIYYLINLRQHLVLKKIQTHEEEKLLVSFAAVQ